MTILTALLNRLLGARAPVPTSVAKAVDGIDMVLPAARCRLRVVTPGGVEMSGRQTKEVKLVISGPIDAVCAELDRLCALESHSNRA